nr:hypothetical protein [uncultured Carboxylicivirga sp.]
MSTIGFILSTLNRGVVPVVPIINLQNANIVVDGNSLSTSQGGGDPYSTTLQSLLNADDYNVTVANVSVGGQTTLAMISDFATEVAPLYDDQKENILLAWEIRNHLVVNSPTVQEAYDQFVNYCNLANQVGFKVVIGTVMPSWTATYKGDSTVTGYELLDSDRLAANVLLRNNYTQFAIGLADIGATTGLKDFHDNEEEGYVFSATRPTTSANGYFADGTHNTASGKAIIAQVWCNELKRLAGLL